MKRIYVKNNYLIIEWNGSAPLMRPKKNIFFFRTNSNPNQYLIKDSLQSIPPGLENVLWTDFIKEDGTAFSSIVEFNDWITTNTGNFNSGSNIGGFDPSKHDLAEFKNISSDPFSKLSQMPPKGDKGDRGEQGLPGINGVDGKDGINGLKGDKGSPGVQGIQGERGLQGEKGNDGSIGPRGLKGEDGATGLQGPKGDQGIQGLKGDTGNQGAPGVNSFSIPTLRTPIAKATAYQALNPLKPAVITITLNAVSNATLTIATNNAANILIGPTTAVSTGTGSIVGKYNNTLSVGVLISTGIANTYTVALPIGWYFAILNASGTTGVTIESVFDQSVG